MANENQTQTHAFLAADNKDKVPDLTSSTQQHYIQQATADNTRRAYRAAIRQFEAQGGKLPATETSIADYISTKATELNPRTLSLHLTALSHWHRYQDLNDPTQSPYIRKLLKGVYRTHGTPKRKAKAFQPQHIETMVQQLHKRNDLKAARDSALIQLAYFGAFRRSELLAMQVEHVRFESQGVLILMPRSKTDQNGQGKVKALRQWLEQSHITAGFIFRGLNRWGELQDKPLHLDSFKMFYVRSELYDDLEYSFEMQYYINKVLPTTIKARMQNRGLDLTAAFFDVLEKNIKALDSALPREKELSMYLAIFIETQSGDITTKKTSVFKEVIIELQNECDNRFKPDTIENIYRSEP